MTEEKEQKEQKEKKLEDIRKEAEEKKCPVQKSLYFIGEFLSGPMCGRCFPCSLGSYEARIRLKSITEGTGTEDDILNLKRIAENMLEASMCKKGKDTAKFILEWMDKGIFQEHIQGTCPDTECLAFIEYRIIPDKCIMCDLCNEACKYDAIIGEKKKSYLSGYHPYEIRQKRCVKCSDCIKVCPTGAIVIAGSKEREPVGV